MPNRIDRIIATIDNHIYVWSSIASFAPMAQILLKNRDVLLEKLLFDRSEAEVSKQGDDYDALRLFLIEFALERLAGRITCEHFTILEANKTVEAVLGDSHGEKSPANRDEVLIPHQKEALKILIECLFHRGGSEEEDLICFLHMFSPAGPKAFADKDRMRRFRSMIWFIYLGIEIVKIDRAVCSQGLESFSDTFGQLMDWAAGEASGPPGLDEGKWEKTLFGRLRGEDGRKFARELKGRFDMGDRSENLCGRLPADRQKAMLEQILVLFGRQ